MILDADDDLRLAGGEDFDDPRETLEGRAGCRAVPRHGEDVDISDRFPHPSERTGRLDAFHGLAGFHSLRDCVDDASGVDEEGPSLPLLHEVDRPLEVLLRLLAEAFDPTQEMLLGRRLQRVEVRDPELLP